MANPQNPNEPKNPNVNQPMNDPQRQAPKRQDNQEGVMNEDNKRK